MDPYPCLHPHLGHSQADPREPLASTCPRASMATVRLDAGQVLFVPPFWWHRVETVTDRAVSLNAWSDAPAYALLEAAYHLPVPLESDWGFGRRVRATRFFLLHVGRQLEGPAGTAPRGGGGGAPSAMGRLVRKRWERIATNGELAAPAAEVAEEVRRHCAAPAPGDAAGHLGASDWAQTEAKILRGARAIVAQLGRIDPAVAELCFGNYAEHVALALVGDAAIVPFLRHCF